MTFVPGKYINTWTFEPQTPDQLPVPANLVILADSLGMAVWQANGQRCYRNMMIDPQIKPANGTEIFITKYPRKCTEADIIPLCNLIAPIYEFRMMLDFSGTNRGFGFVRYYTEQDAENARKVLHNYEIQEGKFIVALKSVDNCRLHIANIPMDKSLQEITEEIRSVAEGVNGVDILQRSDNRFAFVDFETHRQASIARRNFISGRMGLWGQLFTVDWARIR